VVYFNYVLTGGWSFEVRLDMWTGNGNAARTNLQAGIGVADANTWALSNSNSVMNSLVFSVNTNTLDLYCYVKASITSSCGVLKVPSANNGRIYMRMDWDPFTAMYTMKYRLCGASTCAYTTVGALSEVTFASKIVKPRVFMTVYGIANTGTGVADFSEASFYSNTPSGQAAKPYRVYLTGTPTSANLYLPRYTMYRAGVLALGTDGSQTNESLLSTVFVNGPPPTTVDPTVGSLINQVPGTPVFYGLQSAVDASAEYPNKYFDTTVTDRSNRGYNFVPVGSYSQYPSLLINTLFDKSSMYLSTSRYLRSTSTAGTMYQPVYPNTYSSGSSGMTIFLVARSDLSAQATQIPLFCKGNNAYTSIGYSARLYTANAQVGFRTHPTTVTTNYAFTGATQYIAPESTFVYSMIVNQTSLVAGVPWYNLLGRINGANTSFVNGGQFGAGVNDNIATGPFTSLATYFYLGFDGSYYWNGHVYEMLFYQTAMPPSEYQAIEKYLMNKYYLVCPALNATMRSPGNNASVAAGYTNACSSATTGTVCRLQCPASYVAVTGLDSNVVANSSDLYCRDGIWSGGRTSCGLYCPALPKPSSVPLCSKFLEWETFMYLTPTVDRQNFWGTRIYNSQFQSHLLRYGVFPPLPEVAFFDVFNVLADNQIAVTLGSPSFANLYTGENYDPIAVWQARQSALPNNQSIPNGANSSLMHASTLKYQGVSPVNGYLLFTPSPKWLRDGKTALTAPTSFTTRIRPTVGRSGLAYRFTTSSTTNNWALPATTSYYLVEIDAEAMDAAVSRDSPLFGNVMTLYKYQLGTLTTLGTKTWTQMSSLGFTFARGRWYTITATMSTVSQTITITDDKTGQSATAFLNSDVVLAAGGYGLWIDGEAQFDDVRVNTTCAASGSCDGLYSNMHEGTGGYCYYECPPNYLYRGNQFRACGTNGNWSGTPLSCSPPPPTFAQYSPTAPDAARMVNGVPTFFRGVDERSPRNTVVGNQLVARAPVAYPDLSVLYQVLPNDPGNMDPLGDAVFSVDACGGTVKVVKAVLDVSVKPQWNITVQAYVTGELNSIGTVTGIIVIDVRDVNDPPEMEDQEFFLSEYALGGHAFGLPLVATDPDEGQAPPYFVILAGNDAGIFILGPNPPYVPSNASLGQFSLAPTVNIGSFPSTQYCTCKPKVLDFELTPRFTFIVRAMDSIDNRLFGQATVTINVINENDPPYIPTGQIFSLDEMNAAAEGTFIGDPVVAFDDDIASAGDYLTYAITAVYGKKGTDGSDRNMPRLNSSAAWPFAIDETSGQLSIVQALQYIATDPATLFTGILSRSGWRVAVAVTDSWNVTTTVNVTVVIIANITAAAQEPIITQFSSPGDGINTDGTDMVYIYGDFFPYPPTTGVIKGVYTMPASGSSPAVTFTSSCSVFVPETGAPETGMVANCSTSPGLGTDYTWTFRKYVGNANASIPMAANVRAVTSYASPVVYGMGGDVGVDTSRLLTQGNQRINITGANFGPATQRLSDVTVTFTTASPLTLAQTTTYTLTVVSITHTKIIATTPPGVGANLIATIGINKRMATSSLPVASYALPSIVSFSAAPLSGVNTSALSGAGGETVVINGLNFGPLTLPVGTVNISAVAYTPDVFYGPNGDIYRMTDCHRASPTEHTQLTCSTVAGIGRRLRVLVVAGLSGQSSSLSTSYLSYADPVLVGLIGGVEMSTAGNERLVLTGSNFGTPELSVANVMQVRVWYGPAPTFNMFEASSCIITRPSPSSAPQVSCVTAPGTGAGFGVKMAISLVAVTDFRNSDVNLGRLGTVIGYSPPILAAFAGSSSNALTTGGQVVNVNGLNFGFDISLVAVYYTLTLKDYTSVLPVVNGSQLTQVKYRPANCSFITEHTELACVLTPGAGSNLQWIVVVDGQVSRNPSTSYAAPVLRSFSLLQQGSQKPITGADTNGGDTLLVYGSGFGPSNDTGFGGLLLVQHVVLVSPIGLETVVDKARWVLVNDGLLNITIPGGSGAGWSVKLSVADRTVDSGTETFDYASPIITSMTPHRGPTVGNTVVTVDGINFGLLDPLNEVAVLFGNPFDQSLWSVAIKATRVAIPNADGAVYPNRLTFKTPPGFGAGRSIRLLSYRAGTAMPIPRQYNTQPIASMCNATLAARDGVVVNASHCIGVDQFSFNEPAMSVIVITRPSTSEEINFATSRFGSGQLEFVRVLNIYGSNFGSGTAGSPAIDRAIEEQYTDATHPSGAFRPGLLSYQYDLAAWSDTKIVAYTLQTIGTIRLAVTTYDWSGQAVVQRSEPTSFLDYSPVSSLTDSGFLLPSTGGTLLNFTVQFLGSALWFQVTVANNLCQLVDPTNPGQVVTNQNDIQTRIVQNTAVIDPLPISTESLWTVQCVAPAGQGSVAPLVVTRFPPLPAGLSSKLDGALLSYAPPEVTGFAMGSVDDPSSMHIMEYQANTRLRAHTDGSSLLVLVGRNLGTCPYVTIATHVLCFCRSSCPEEGVIITEVHTSGYDRYANLSGSQDRIQLSVPPGEGDGTPITGDNVGWTITVTAGDQLQISGVVLFGYLPPRITSVVGTSGFPTRGNVTVTIVGEDFGQALPNFAMPPGLAPTLMPLISFFQPHLATPVMMPCTNAKRISQTVITCRLPPGAGVSLSAVVSVFGQSNITTDMLTYNQPVITNFSFSYTDNSTGVPVLVPQLARAAGNPSEAVGPTSGGFNVTIRGKDFGPSNSEDRCVFVAWKHRTSKTVFCDGYATFEGEGELHSSKITLWTDDRIVFIMPPGAGRPEIIMAVAGQTCANGLDTDNDPSFGTGAPFFRYLPPSVSRRLVPDHAPTDTSALVELFGTNLAYVTAGPLASNTSFPLLLAADTVVPPTYSVRVNWGPQPFLNAAKYPNWQPPGRTGPCVCSTRPASGIRGAGCRDCLDGVMEHSHGRMLLSSFPGVGKNVSISVSVIDGTDVYTSDSVVAFDYDPPRITRFAPLPIVVGATDSTLLRTTGENFGTTDVMASYLPDYDPQDNTNVYNQAYLYIDGNSTWCLHSMRTKVSEKRW
jgi:hypothetical protein